MTRLNKTKAYKWIINGIADIVDYSSQTGWTWYNNNKTVKVTEQQAINLIEKINQLGLKIIEY